MSNIFEGFLDLSQRFIVLLPVELEYSKSGLINPSFVRVSCEYDYDFLEPLENFQDVITELFPREFQKKDEWFPYTKYDKLFYLESREDIEKTWKNPKLLNAVISNSQTNKCGIICENYVIVWNQLRLNRIPEYFQSSERVAHKRVTSLSSVIAYIENCVKNDDCEAFVVNPENPPQDIKKQVTDWFNTISTGVALPPDFSFLFSELMQRIVYKFLYLHGFHSIIRDDGTDCCKLIYQLQNKSNPKDDRVRYAYSEDLKFPYRCGAQKIGNFELFDLDKFDEISLTQRYFYKEFNIDRIDEKLFLENFKIILEN